MATKIPKNKSHVGTVDATEISPSASSWYSNPKVPTKRAPQVAVCEWSANLIVPFAVSAEWDLSYFHAKTQT
jgi:hypothetical protein